MKLRHILFLVFACFILCGFSWPFSWMFSIPNNEQYGSHAWVNREVEIIKSQSYNIDDKVLRLSLIAYTNARRKGIADNKQLLTVIDYSKLQPSRSCLHD